MLAGIGQPLPLSEDEEEVLEIYADDRPHCSLSLPAQALRPRQTGVYGRIRGRLCKPEKMVPEQLELGAQGERQLPMQTPMQEPTRPVARLNTIGILPARPMNSKPTKRYSAQ